MKLLLGTPGWGWRLFGIVGKDSDWFIGYSRNITVRELVAAFHDVKIELRPKEDDRE